MSEKSEPQDLTGTIFVGTDAPQRGAELRDKMIKECEEYDKIASLYKDWIEAIALNNSLSGVLDHLRMHLNSPPSGRYPNVSLRWRLSLLNLFAIIEKQLQSQSDIKEQCKIIFEKALEYQENFNDDGDYFENDFIEQYKKITGK